MKKQITWRSLSYRVKLTYNDEWSVIISHSTMNTLVDHSLMHVELLSNFRDYKNISQFKLIQLLMCSCIFNIHNHISGEIQTQKFQEGIVVYSCYIVGNSIVVVHLIKWQFLSFIRKCLHGKFSIISCETIRKNIFNYISIEKHLNIQI